MLTQSHYIRPHPQNYNDLEERDDDPVYSRLFRLHLEFLFLDDILL